MGIGQFFHNLRTGVARSFQPALPNVSQEKQYGDWGEDALAYRLRMQLPTAAVKRNVIVRTNEGNAEIDCLVQYKNKLFAIEVKRWKGVIAEQGDYFVQYKQDTWTDDVHTKSYRSPFKQLGRAVYLLRKQIEEPAWINPVVFFADAERVAISSDQTWFTDVDRLLAYIVHEGRPSPADKAQVFFNRCIAADCVYDLQGQALRYIVCDDFLRFCAPNVPQPRAILRGVQIQHHWAHDELHIFTRNGGGHVMTLENGAVHVLDNGRLLSLPLCKVAYIDIAER